MGGSKVERAHWFIEPFVRFLETTAKGAEHLARIVEAGHRIGGRS